MLFVNQGIIYLYILCIIRNEDYGNVKKTLIDNSFLDTQKGGRYKWKKQKRC